MGKLAGRVSAKRTYRDHPRRRRVIGLALGSVVLAAFGTGVAYAATNSPTIYRTAVAALGSVDETLTVNGTIASATRRDLAFPVDGTVNSVKVAIGDEVSAGDTLATLDTDDLEAAVTDAQSKVSEAEQALDEDLTGQTSTSSGSGSSAPAAAAATTVSSAGSGSSPAVTAAIAAVTQAQQDLLAAITAADAALATSQTAGTTASTACAAFAAATLPAAGDPADPAYDAAAQATALQAALADAQAQLTACQSSTSALGSAQEATSTAQAAVSTASAALDAAVQQLQTALASSSGGGGSSQPSGGSSQPSSSGSGGGGSGGSTASAADIVADRAAITAAEAQVALARQQLAAATLTSPISGTVAAISLTVGAAASSDAVISVIGSDGYLIESTVSLAQLPKLEKGQDVAVTLSSTGASYEGSVTAVGITNVSETSDPAYAVTVSVDPAGDVLLNGAAASAAIAVASSSDVLTVPVSALTGSGSSYTVSLLVDGSPVPTAVSVGAVGSSLAEITSGLSVGDVVVLADLSSTAGSTSSSSTSTSTGLTGLGGDSGPSFTGGPPSGFTGSRPNG